MNPRLEPGERDVLIVVDIQNDFCPGGALSVPRGDEVVPVVNRLARRFRHVVLTQDWHPPRHQSFASEHPGRQPYETIAVAYGPQILWPDHCIQGTRGAAFRDDLDIPHAELIVRKGYRREVDSYSALFENDHAHPDRPHRLSQGTPARRASSSPASPTISASAIPPRMPTGTASR